MRNSLQANLPPMEVARVDRQSLTGKRADSEGARLPPSSTESVNTGDSRAVEILDSIDLLTVARAAARRCSYYDKELADIFQLSPSLASKAFDPNNDTHNKPMKAQLPKAYAEAFVREMAQLLGLRIGGSEAQTRAFKNVLRACHEFVEASDL